jgi:hypothetical protein
MLDPTDIPTAVADIAAQLGETESYALEQIQRVVAQVGIADAYVFLERTVYLTFIARKQWRKVAAALEADPEDRLIVEGYPALDKKLGVIGVLAQSVTTTGLQAAKRRKA